MAEDLRVGDWAQTFTGRKFWVLDPRSEDVCIEDIAHALSLICRFGGHCRRFYSVAQHSWLVSREVPRADALPALLHDAAEAYVGDMVRPLKRSMPDFERSEEKVYAAIARRFGVPLEVPSIVKHADEVLLATEARDIMGGESAGRWTLRVAPLTETIDPWDPAHAERMFLDRFVALIGARGSSPSELTGAPTSRGGGS